MVDPVDGRTAFEICLIQQRKDSSCINGVAVDNDGLHFYVGLDSGFIEEYKIVYGPTGCIARVCAKRQLSKKGIKSVCLLGGAGMLAVLIEDGSVLLCDLDQLQPMPVTGSKNTIQVACDPRYLSPCKFAIAVKSGIRKYQVDVYQISRGWDSELKLVAQYPMQEEIKHLAWLDNDIIVASRSTYYSIHDNEMSPILQPKGSTLFTILPIPDLAVLLWEDCLAVIVDASGSAARPPLAFDSKPLLLTQGGMCIVSISESNGITIFDQNNSKLVQQLPFNIKSVFAEDEHPITLHHADTPSGSTILMASSRNVWMLRPVAHEAQTIQLLKSGSIEAALELAESCLTESWAEDLFAQAGLLLLQQGKWKFALDSFQRCSSSVFQPSQLFPLFPKWTRKWANQVCLKSYWGLHRELGDLKSLVEYRQRLESLRMDNEDFTTMTSKDPQEEKTAQNHIANYLTKVRHHSNIHCIDGVDALIIYLLSSTDRVEELEAFVQTEHQAEIENVRGHLIGHQRFLALALMAWKKVKFEEALEILKKLSFNECQESKATNGCVHDAEGNQSQVATYYTAIILSQSEMDELVLERNLKWLVEISPFRFLQICQVCALNESVILNLIPPKNIQLQFRYLHHIVHTSHNPTHNSHHHTKLALLISQLLEGQADFDTNEEKSPFMFAADDGYFRNPESQVSASQTNVLNFEHIFKQRLLLPISTEPPKGSAEIQELNVFNGQELREILQHHLLISKEYDAVEILKNLEQTCLYEEQVILSCRLKDHVQALRILAITLKDIHSAIRYCKLYAGDEGFISLLDMLLKPGQNQEPLYTEAVQVLNAESGNLDPMRVLDTLSETMPLSIAYPTISRMLRERTHRKRQTNITHQLCKVQNILYKAEKHDLESGFLGRVYVDAETECVLCRKKLGGKIFYKYPSGALVCGKCQRDRTEEDQIQH